MNLEFLSGNELKRFPFTDNSRLESDSGFVFNNGLLLDALIYQKTPANSFYSLYDTTLSKAFYVRLTKLEVAAATNVKLQLSFINVENDYTILDTELTIPAEDVIYMKTVVIDDDDYWVKLVFGREMVNLLSQNIDEDFSSLRFTDTAVVQPLPRVTQLSLYNEDTLYRTIVTDQETDVEVAFQEGSNISILNNTEGVNLDVFSGYGTGLYDACSDELFISTINSIPPSVDNNFLFLADNCYTTTPLEHGLLLENHCKPKCTNVHFENFVHYLNRIKDGISDVGALANSTGTELTTQIADYNSTYVPVKNKPYIKYAYAKFPAAESTYFYSVVVGIFNPRNEDIEYDITVIHDGFYVPDTGRWRVKDTALTLASPAKDGILPCLSVGKLEFVFRGAPLDTFTITGTLDGVSVGIHVNIT